MSHISCLTHPVPQSQPAGQHSSTQFERILFNNTIKTACSKKQDSPLRRDREKQLGKRGEKWEKVKPPLRLKLSDLRHGVRKNPNS